MVLITSILDLIIWDIKERKSKIKLKKKKGEDNLDQNPRKMLSPQNFELHHGKCQSGGETDEIEGNIYH